MRLKYGDFVFVHGAGNWGYVYDAGDGYEMYVIQMGGGTMLKVASWLVQPAYMTFAGPRGMP